MAFANHLPKASTEVVQFGTTSTKYLYVEGKSDKNIMARLVLARPNNVIIKNISDDQIPDEHLIPNIDLVQEAKLKVTRICNGKRVHGLVDRDGDDPKRFPPRCLSTDCRDLESTMFHYGGQQYVHDLLNSLTSPITPLPQSVVDSFCKRLEKLASLLNGYFFPNGPSWGPYGSVCIKLDNLQPELQTGATDRQILEAIAFTYGRPAHNPAAKITPKGEVNGHILVATFAILIRLEVELRTHLERDQMDVQFLDQRFEGLKKQTEKAMQLSVLPPLKEARMTTRIISELNLTTFPEWW